MSVRKKYENPKNEPVDIDALIEKGAKVKEDHVDEKKKWSYMTLRMSSDMVLSVDKAVKERVGITRTGWILEAIHEKLKRE